MHRVWFLLGLAVVSFLQNMAFTWVSRSRNSGDPDYHRYASWCSNGVWLFTTLLIQVQVIEAIKTGSWWWMIVVGAVYIVCTTEGSVLMMKILLKNESGKRMVGSR